MSDKRISELVELTTLAADDELVVVDADANGTKRVTYDTLATDIRTEAEPLTATTLNLGDSTAISNLGADQYRLTATASSTGVLTSWESVNNTASATLGSGVTVSSGNFNVPTNGVWLIATKVLFELSGGNFATARLSINGNFVQTFFMLEQDRANTVTSLSGLYVASLTTTDDVALNATGVSSNSEIVGNTENVTTLSFLRLGDA